MNNTIRKGYGFNVGQNFARAAYDIPCELAPKEYAPKGTVIAYIPENRDSSLGFLKYGTNGRVRVWVDCQALAEPITA